MFVRKAFVKDAPDIYNLVNLYARDGLLLPRSMSSIYEDIRDFWVCEEEGKLVGCAALHVVWEDLAEIKSLAVAPHMKGKGIGGLLVRACVEEAKQLGIRRVFVLTYAVGFFEKHGFKTIPKDKLPHKVWGECINCIKFPSCDETAMWIELDTCVEELGVVDLRHEV
ncbi:GCN5-related N-acetyltransferase [Thermocrinis albus DSM 14484]|uniref:GCN5-related N-acetyltransferase n=1 Tax=Thermocrinis albus (strain DSM 14484 / JCM 11386 / HI 11/12) TaxID=638303 RepID=D3SM99_THEAH|nr:N-acetyltransferase [Thermocrinis albus]ADC89879.1 GCN5-related N-acetyltransferase [Thermocrinis albus DSM 14484]